MKRLLTALTASLFFSACASHAAPKTIPTHLSASQVVVGSIVRVEVLTPTGQYVCTGFSIAPRKYVTAAHCTVPLHEETDAVLKVDGKAGLIIKEDVDRDLSVVVADLVKPTLTLRDDPLVENEFVQAMGYGYGFKFPLITSHTVMFLHYALADGVWPGTVLMGGFIGGMSGGPIYDHDGQVVGVVQRATSQVGYGVGIDVLQEFLN